MNDGKHADENRTVWTIGHSTLSMEEFLARLLAFDIEFLADVRRFPGSRRYPHFNNESLRQTLAASNIGYEHMEALGGRRKSRPDSDNTAWRNASFRGYADYMETPDFAAAVARLETLAAGQRLAFMCSEATWWRCHRALVADYLKAKGWQVYHIMDVDKATTHPYTSPARAHQGKLSYTPDVDAEASGNTTSSLSRRDT